MPPFEILPSGKAIKLGLGRVRVVTSFQDFYCERGDQQVAQRKCLMLVLFSGAKTIQIGWKELDRIRYLYGTEDPQKRKRRKK